MKKKLMIIIPVVLVLVVVATLAYLNNRNRTLSPPGKTELANGTLRVSVLYSRPSVRNRVIFGTKEQNALQPYGEYWRLGANESTEITFNRDVLIDNSKPLNEGTYRVYAIPGPETFEIVFNKETGVWGVFTPDEEEDVLRVTLPVDLSGAPTEQFIITLEPAGASGINIIFAWEKVRFVLPVQ